ncbi:MAG: exonuclease domain-containing protein [Magnetovibrionaceae bacterium]
MIIVALDFETAGPSPLASCALGLARVEGQAGGGFAVTATDSFLIRPPDPDVRYTEVHGLTWDDLKDQPDFATRYHRFLDFLDGATHLAAHNAGFDRSVLMGGCEGHGLQPPDLPWICTVRLARSCWDIRPTKLPDVCRWLGIPLKHHDAGSDARACGQIVADGLSDGLDISAALLPQRGLQAAKAKGVT